MVLYGMTLINVDLRDSKGSPLVGTLRVKLDYTIVDSSGSNTIYLPVAATISLVNGSATVELEPSELARVTYLFEVYQNTTVDATIVETIIWSFRAKVPDSPTAIALTELIQTTGITNDALDSSLTAVTRRLYNSEDFWTRLQEEVFRHQGEFAYTAWYRRGDIVSFQGSGYLYFNSLATTGNVPTNAQYWRLVASIGATGAGTTGNPSTYDATGWLNQTDAPSRGAVRNIIETLATKTEVNSKVSAVDATLTRPRIVADPTANDRSSLAVSSQWVQALADTIKKALVPIGTVCSFAGSSAPTGWVLCDGRLLDRTTYSALFAILSTTFNTGGETASQFRVPDLRGRVPVGLDNMSALQGAASRIASLIALGLSGGAATHTLLVNEIPSHNHILDSFPNNATTGGYTGAIDAVGAKPGLNKSYVEGANITNTGGGAAHNNLQPYLGLNAIIYAAT